MYIVLTILFCIILILFMVILDLCEARGIDKNIIDENIREIEDLQRRIDNLELYCEKQKKVIFNLRQKFFNKE